MDLSQAEVKNLKYNWLDTIDLELNHPTYGWIPFTASPDDVEEHGKAIYAKAIAGDYGPIAPFVAPADIVGEEALNMLRQKRDDLLVTEVDPLVSNPLRWADLGQEKQALVAAYRQALLDMPENNPNAAYTFSKETGDFVEKNITWPELNLGE